MPLPRAARLLAPLALAASVLAALPARADAPLPPNQDPFYTYTGSVPLARIPPGAVLKERSVQVSFGTSGTPLTAEQLLYRTTGQLGQPTVTVTTVLAPVRLPTARIVEYLSFYDGLGATCDPSYTLRGGDPDATTEQQVEEEDLLINWYLTNGYLVTVPDFEGTQLDWMAGQQSGYGALDAVRATESYLHLPAGTPVGLSGYSGGAVAADWASELAPSYSPGLHLVGVAEGGIPVDYAHLLAYINGDSVYSSVDPGLLLGLARAFHIDLTDYLSPYGQRLVRAESDVCIDEVFSRYPGLTYQQLMKPRYRDLLHVPVFVRTLNDEIMGTAPGHPRVPLFMGVGNSDGRGDGVMLAGDVEALAYEYCQQGVPVQFEEYRDASHEDAGVYFEPEADAFLQARFAGAPFRGNCSSIGRGNSLAPQR